ncbi:hypothetical protein GCM10009689_17270 [Brevibacterium antiquum]
MDDLHIGKRSVGWQFSFRAYPSIQSRRDWEARVAEVGSVMDEYGQELSPVQFWAAVDATREPRSGGSAPLSHFGMRGKQNIPVNDPNLFLDDQGWDFSEHEFS